MIPNYPPTHVDIRIYMPRGYIQYHDKLFFFGITYLVKQVVQIFSITYFVNTINRLYLFIYKYKGVVKNE